MLERLLATATHQDLRVNLASLGVLRNLSIPPANKEILSNAGLIPICVKHISNRENANQLIQYTSVGILKNLLLGDKMIASFLAAGGLDALIPLANGEIPILNLEGINEKDPRVQYESARLLARLVERGNSFLFSRVILFLKDFSKIDDCRSIIVKNGGVLPILNLLKTQFDILKEEGVKCLYTLSKKGDQDTKNYLKSLGVVDILKNISFVTKEKEIEIMPKEIMEELQK